MLRTLKYALTGVALAATLTSAKAADVTINLGFAAPEASSYGLLANKFEELAEKYSDGSLDIKVRCCTQLATEDEAFKSMQLGTVDMYIMTHNNISPHFPPMEAFVLPYIFQSTEHAYKVLDGDVGKSLAAEIEAATKLTVLTFGYVEYRDFYNTERPINNIDDIKGIRVRVPQNNVMIKTHEAFGSVPLPIAWSETLAALQTGAVSAGDSGASFVKSQKFYEIAKNLAVLEHFAFFTPLLASKRVMGKLDDAQKGALRRAAKEAGDFQRSEMATQLKDAREFLSTEGGMTVTYPDKAGFIAAGIKVQDGFIAEKGDENLKNVVLKIRAAAE